MNDLDTKLTACAAGHGISQALEFGLGPLLASGELVQILADWAEERFPSYVYHPSRRLPPDGVASRIDWHPTQVHLRFLQLLRAEARAGLRAAATGRSSSVACQGRRE